MGTEIFTQAPPYFIGFALVIFAFAHFTRQRNEALKDRAEALEAQRKKDKDRLDEVELETGEKIEKLNIQIDALEGKIDEMKRMYDSEIKRLQEMLLDSQREGFRLKGILADNGIRF